HGPRQSVPGVITAGLSVVLAPINVYLALAFLVLNPSLYFVPQARRYMGRRLSALWRNVGP
ncbi:hypothetical protein, partial [Micromonospora sp. BL1]|uniref:hypothetical protein n=1 Tax=Micromonospora sp. BL1 TaxID=2478709 RepID=UPI001F3E911B